MRFKSLLWGSFTSMSHLCVFSWSRNFTFSFILHMCVFSTFFRKLQLLRTTSWRRTDLLDPYLIFYFCRINKFIFWIAFKTLLAGVIKWKILFGRLHFRRFRRWRCQNNRVRFSLSRFGASRHFCLANISEITKILITSSKL